MIDDDDDDDHLAQLFSIVVDYTAFAAIVVVTLKG